MTMGRLGKEARGAMTVLLERGHTKSDVARLLGVSEGTVRYHERRMKRGAIDGRSLQEAAASVHADAIEHWRGQREDAAINLVELHAWLRREHGYTGSLRSIQRYWKRTFPAPAIRARRASRRPLAPRRRWTGPISEGCSSATKRSTLLPSTWCCLGAARRPWSGRARRTCCSGKPATRPASRGWAACRRRRGWITRRRRSRRAPVPGAR